MALEAQQKSKRIDVHSLSEEELYLNIHITAARKILITKYEHNALFWAKSFNHYSNVVLNDPSQRHNHWRYFKGLRKLIYRQTSSILEKGHYNVCDANNHNKTQTITLNKDSFKRSIQNTVGYHDTRHLLQNKTELELKNNDNDDKQITTLIEIKNMDCIDAAHDLYINGYCAAVLNCGGSRHAGGGWTDGAGAQEENLFRRTSYSVCLNRSTNCELYPISKYGVIYSPNIIVFRGNEKNQGYKLLSDPFELSFIICCMIRHPKMDKNNKNRYIKEKKINSIICDKIRSIFRVALYNEHDSIVLTAIGCGDFANPPENVAKCFKEVINEKDFKNKFKKIVFAILDDHNARKAHNPQGNLKPFIDVFKDH